MLEWVHEGESGRDRNYVLGQLYSGKEKKG